MTPFESAVEGSLEGSRGGRTHVHYRDQASDRATPLSGTQLAFDDRHRTLDLKVLLKRLAEPQSVAERVLDHDGWAAGEGWVNARAELGMWA